MWNLNTRKCSSNNNDKSDQFDLPRRSYQCELVLYPWAKAGPVFRNRKQVITRRWLLLQKALESILRNSTPREKCWSWRIWWWDMVVRLSAVEANIFQPFVDLSRGYRTGSRNTLQSSYFFDPSKGPAGGFWRCCASRYWGSGRRNSSGLPVSLWDLRIRVVALSRMFGRHLPASAGFLHSFPVLHQPWSHFYQVGTCLLSAEPSSGFWCHFFDYFFTVTWQTSQGVWLFF